MIDIVDFENEVYTGVLSDSLNTYDICVSKAIPIKDETVKGEQWYKQIVSKVDSINGNIRLYPRSIYSAALDKLKEKGFPNAGEHPHPDTYIGMNGELVFQTSIPNSAVKFRNAFIDENNNVWAEYKVLDTDMGKQVQVFIDNNLPFGFSNRMTGKMVSCNIDGKVVDVAKELELYTWDILLNPAESNSIGLPIPLSDSIEVLLNINDNKNNKGDNKQMDFSKMNLDELKKWKDENKDSKDIALCDYLISIKENERKVQEDLKKLTDELNTKNEELENKSKELENKNKELENKNKKLEQTTKEKEAEEKRKQAQKVLTDEVNKLTYDEKTKQAIIDSGKDIKDSNEVAAYIEKQKAVIDTIVVNTKLKDLGVPQDMNKQGRAATITVNENNLLNPIVDGLMNEMDIELQKKNPDFKIDKELRKANKEIIDNILKQMERNKNKEYKEFMSTLNDGLKVINDAESSTTGQFAQSSVLSLAIMYQAWQDVKFLQLCMTESFSGSTYKMPVEFQSHDLFSEDDFSIGELEGIPTESIQTFTLEFGAEWLKRGFVVTKEAEKELFTGPMRYDIISRNAANIANRFTRIIDRMISTEMIARADEYQAKKIINESVSASEVEELTAGVNAPISTNAKFKVKLLCGNSSPLSDNAVIAPIVRPRVSVWLDSKGRKQSELINEIIVKDSSGTILKEGKWISSSGKIMGNNVQYAVDYENSVIYFVDGVISTSNLPTIEQYSYATNIAYFNLAIPKSMSDFPARYYNKLLEMIDIQKGHMGSAPRYVTPDFILGSLNAMIPFKQAELFYQRALPDGTSLLGGEMYFAKRNGIDIGEHNIPWATGDSRLLLGKRNAVRVGMGSPYDLEGPYPHLDSVTGTYTTAKDYFASQQIAINTPLVIDENGIQYHPPFRTIKYYAQEH